MLNHLCSPRELTKQEEEVVRKAEDTEEVVKWNE